VGAILIWIDSWSRVELLSAPLFLALFFIAFLGFISAAVGDHKLKESKRFRFERVLGRVAMILFTFAVAAFVFGPLLPRRHSPNLRGKAQGEVMHIAMAVKQYYSDYRKMPIGSDGDTVHASRAIIKMLIANDPGSNPRNTVYVELETSAVNGTFLDPWGTQYRMYLDGNYDGRVVFGGSSYLTSCIAVSAGKDRTFGTSDDIESVK